jgi:CubicO group peptidase (beta-lactamase class C family)
MMAQISTYMMNTYSQNYVMMCLRQIIVQGLVLALIVAVSIQVKAQNSFASIDSFFYHYSERNGPGYVVGIVQDGDLVYSNAYGSANLDYNIPLSDSSAFYIGSMAKQFTAAALLLLESEGKLLLTDEVTKYFPSFPDYGEPITLAHLLYHTSGIREAYSLALFQGFDPNFEEVYATEDIVELMISQRDLNFIPGEEFRYSSGGYSILVKVIEQVSQMSFRDFAYQHIFDPLKMTSTFVCDDHNDIVPNRAVSYFPLTDSTFERRVQVFDAYGDGGIITTLEDLVKWDQAFYSEALGIANFSNKMYQVGSLNNGTELTYARALNVWEYRGEKVVQHNGGMLGFRVDLVRFPDHNTSIILLGNQAFLNPTRDALKIADRLLDFKEEESMTTNSTDAITLSPLAAKELVGTYFFDDWNNWKKITYRDSVMYIDGNQPIHPKEDGTYQANVFGTLSDISFINDSLSITNDYWRRKGQRIDDTPPQSKNELEAFIGEYYCSELRTTHRMYWKDDQFVMQISDKEPIILYPNPTDDRVNWNSKDKVWIGFAMVRFVFSEDGEVVGYNIGDFRVKEVFFKKI